MEIRNKQTKIILSVVKLRKSGKLELSNGVVIPQNEMTNIQYRNTPSDEWSDFKNN
jgi:hypothetical protein